mmetsp:Transcript_59144/g.72326  ORF Transcript_59144/g.72326 Transcript_59144/m.72326 type:complete len:171 (-) Transcript_59144:59-571(-)
MPVFFVGLLLLGNVLGNECTFKAVNDDTKILNLTTYVDILNVTDGIQCSEQGCHGCGYQYSPCNNSIKCSVDKSKAMIIQNSVSNGECIHELGMYNNNILPKYYDNNDTWFFEYNNGDKCENNSNMNYSFNIQFICSNDNWPQARTEQINACQYQMNISSLYTCKNYTNN